MHTSHLKARSPGPFEAQGELEVRGFHPQSAEEKQVPRRARDDTFDSRLECEVPRAGLGMTGLLEAALKDGLYSCASDGDRWGGGSNVRFCSPFIAVPNWTDTRAEHRYDRVLS